MKKSFEDMENCKMEIDRKELVQRFNCILNDTGMLFKQKNHQYATGDALANFRKGALIHYGKDNPFTMFAILKDYMNKHVAHLYNNDIAGEKIRESLGDIVVYSILGMIMIGCVA